MTPGADLTRWATFVVWEDEGALDAFLAGGGGAGALLDRWTSAEETWSVRLHPIASHGRWGGIDPFPDLPAGDDGDGPVAALTRARIRGRSLRAFYGSIADVDADLLPRADLLASVGVGEWPLALQGTFSLWSSTQALRDFAYRSPHHGDVVTRTREEDWYGEELFARFRPSDSRGTWNGRDPLART